jgi:hypothetical protein
VACEKLSGGNCKGNWEKVCELKEYVGLVISTKKRLPWLCGCDGFGMIGWMIPNLGYHLASLAAK